MKNNNRKHKNYKLIISIFVIFGYIAIISLNNTLGVLLGDDVEVQEL